MFRMDGNFPYGCGSEFIYSGEELRKSQNHDNICEFNSTDIDNEKRKQNICNEIKKKYLGKHVWALYGANDEDKWICLQVASRKIDDIVTEILNDIECMKKENLIEGRPWRSKFHPNVFQPDYEYILSDINHQKYQLMKEKFVKLMFVAPKIEILDDNLEIKDKDKIYQYIEVKYACDTEPLFWNAFGEEHNIVKQFKK